MNFDPQVPQPFYIAKTNPEKRASYFMIGIAGLMVLAFFQIIAWDKHFLSVIPLKLSSLMGTASAEDHGKLAQICMERGKYDCAIASLNSQMRLSPQDHDVKYKLGILLVKTDHLQDAALVLSSYIENGGEEPRARFELAKAYSHLGKTKEALQQYQHLLKKRSDVFQVTVTREYVNTLIQAKKWSHAKLTIEKARKASVTHNAFMTAEYNAVLKQMGGRSVASQ